MPQARVEHIPTKEFCHFFQIHLRIARVISASYDDSWNVLLIRKDIIKILLQPRSFADDLELTVLGEPVGIDIVHNVNISLHVLCRVAHGQLYPSYLQLRQRGADLLQHLQLVRLAGALALKLLHAQCAGAAREDVVRLLDAFKDVGLLAWTAAILEVINENIRCHGLRPEPPSCEPRS